MRKDPTEFRERFKKWQSGEKVYEAGLPKYEDGYESFLATLPDNQKKPGAYNTRRYWELNGKPKNFAEAIGLGMYTFENDNAWHANSVAYNDKNDTYEFMKPNYHETRWMELVYGYDKDPEFLKEWKVKYNGPMLSDRYVRREKPGLKVKGGLLPKFADGKTPEYVLAGTDNSWNKVTNDSIGAAFLDVVVRPLSRGGNTSVGSWKKLWEPKLEKGLLITSPEFDLISGIRGITGMLPKKATTITAKNAAKITARLWDDAYMSAVGRKDMKEVLRLRDLHFKVKTPGNQAVDANGNPMKQYHTVSDEHNPNFNTFDPTIEGEHSSIYTSDDPFMSGTYSSKLVSEEERNHIIETTRKMNLSSMKRITNPDDFDIKQIKLYSDPKKARKKLLKDHPWLNGKIYSDQLKQLYSYIKNPVVIDNSGKDWAHLSLSNLPNDVYNNMRVDIRGGIGDWYSTRSLERAIKDLDYDGAIIKNISDFGGRKRYFNPDVMNSNGTVYQIKNNNMLKYADPITYDDAGKIIPLSLRDNFNIADLRYGIVPTLIGTSAYLMYK